MYKRLKAHEEKPKRSRKAVSRFETTAEWRMMKADIDKGLKPQEALQVVLTKEDKAKYNIQARRSIARFIQKYLAGANLPYKVTSWENRDSGDFCVLVKYVPVMSQRA